MLHQNLFKSKNNCISVVVAMATAFVHFASFSLDFVIVFCQNCPFLCHNNFLKQTDRKNPVLFFGREYFNWLNYYKSIDYKDLSNFVDPVQNGSKLLLAKIGKITFFTPFQLFIQKNAPIPAVIHFLQQIGHMWY